MSIDSTSSWILAESVLSRASSESSIAPLLSARPRSRSEWQVPADGSNAVDGQQHPHHHHRAPHALTNSLSSSSNEREVLTRPSSPLSSDEDHSVGSSARGRPLRARSWTETSDSGQSDAHTNHLVMPSIALHQPHPPSIVSAQDPPTPRSRVLILGKSHSERLALATLLAHDRASSAQPSSEMESSFLSSKPSEASSGSAWSCQWLRPLELHASHATFWLPSAAATAIPGRFVEWLSAPLEALEAKINRAYPVTDGLASLIGHALEDDLLAALFLFSAREYAPPPH